MSIDVEALDGLPRLWWCPAWGTLNEVRYHGNDGPDDPNCGKVAYVRDSDLARLVPAEDNESRNRAAPPQSGPTGSTADLPPVGFERGPVSPIPAEDEGRQCICGVEARGGVGIWKPNPACPVHAEDEGRLREAVAELLRYDREHPASGGIAARIRDIRRVLAATPVARSHPHDGFAYDGCVCICCANVRALAATPEPRP